MVKDSEKNEADMKKRVEEYASHLETISNVFNGHAQQVGLGIRLDVADVVAAVRKGAAFAKVMRFVDRPDDSGVLHDAQLMTGLDCIAELLTAPQRNGLVLGAMQSGKTTTSLALQFAGPIVYLLTGRCLYPIYLITSHTSQEDQTKMEITRFLDFYGDLSIVIDNQRRCTLIEYAKKLTVDPGFMFSPTVNTYREYILKQALPDTFIGPRLDDFIHRRAPGEGIKRIADLCRTANSKNFAPLLLIDEPQYGASDRFVEVDGEIQRRPCVLLQIFDQIQKALGDDAPDRVFIGFSATPYELHDVEAVWRVTQYLKSTYSGFNCFGGKVIDTNAEVIPPKTVSFSAFGEEIGQPFLGSVALTAYDAPVGAFRRFAKKIGFTGTQTEYQQQVEKTLRATIMHMAKRGTTPATGICVRLFNNNLRSHRFLERLGLNNQEIEVIEYFGSDYKGHSVKRAISERARPDLPFLVAVTNRARMGDAFPKEVEWFLEFSKKAADLNALLQGLLGRACGYGKHSTVVMSTDNANIVEDYKRTDGDYIYKTSRHSLVVGPYRRGAPTILIRVLREMNDPLIQEYFARLDREVVEPHIIQPAATLRSRRAKGEQYRTGPVLRIAEELGLFEYLERPEVRKRLFPTYPEFRIARAGDEVAHARDPNKKLRYTLDADGDCRFTFRRYEGDGSHGGMRSRGYGKRDATNSGAAGDTLEPQVNMLKHDPVSGRIIDDLEQEGYWRSAAVTLPLTSSVRVLQAGEVTYPVQHSPFAKLMSEDERAAAGFSPEA
jgi:hypothetical protein